jgi:hypothetical protein
MLTVAGFLTSRLEFCGGKSLASSFFRVASWRKGVSGLPPDPSYCSRWAV